MKDWQFFIITLLLGVIMLHISENIIEEIGAGMVVAGGLLGLLESVIRND